MPENEAEEALQPLPQAAELHRSAAEAFQKGDALTAETLVRTALAADPSNPQAHMLLGLLLERAHHVEAAVAAFQRAIAIRPAYPEAYGNLGNVLKAQDKFDEAVECYRHALTLRPEFPEVLSNLGIALKAQGKLEEALRCYRQALALRPDFPEALANLGAALKAQGGLDKAIVCYRQALNLRPHYPEAFLNLGIALKAQNKLEEAAKCFRQAIAQRPDYPEAHFELGLLLLFFGDYANGWREYECRPKANATKPDWQGEQLVGSVLLHAEQGHGDTIQFLRYVPLVAERCASVVVRVQRPLKRLVEAQFGGRVMVIAQDAPLPSFDRHCSLASLPLTFGTTLSSIPAASGYLRIESEAAESWRNRLGRRAKLRIGLVWAGNPKHANDCNRSVGLARLAPLFDIADCEWFALQVGERAADLAQFRRDNVIDLSLALTDFYETAAAIAALDIVVSVDTSVAHLAGAMGKPVCVMLCSLPDWRWLRRGEHSPWYASAQLFRQAGPGDWDSVVVALREALARRAELYR